jgi:hypothetical protein
MGLSMRTRKGSAVPKGFVSEGRGLVVPAEAQEGSRRVAEALSKLVPGAHREIADQLHWSPSHLSHVFKHRHPLKLSEMLAICSVLGADPLEVLGQVLGRRDRQPDTVKPEREEFDRHLEAFAGAAAKAGYNEPVLRELLSLIRRLK